MFRVLVVLSRRNIEKNIYSIFPEIEICIFNKTF